MPTSIRFAANLAADVADAEFDDADWCPPTVSLPLFALTYGRHAAPLAAIDGVTGAEEREASAEEPARTGRWQAVRCAATRLGGWAIGRTA